MYVCTSDVRCIRRILLLDKEDRWRCSGVMASLACGRTRAARLCRSCGPPFVLVLVLVVVVAVDLSHDSRREYGRSHT